MSKDIQKTSEALQNAINSGDKNKAAKLAQELAKGKATVFIDIPETTTEKSIPQDAILLVVNVESILNSYERPLMYFVTLDTTIGVLKEMVNEDTDIPIEWQYWFVGQRLRGDSVTLKQCGVTKESPQVHLYISNTGKATVGDNLPEWVCTSCTMPNEGKHNTCSTCSTKRPR